MPYNKEQKIKLLVLYDLLCRKTDEEHALSTENIISELSKLNIELSRKTLPQDIQLLNEYGYEVLSYKKKHNYYYVVDRKVENAEVTLLSDVIKASKLNLGQKSSLIQKLTKQLGEHKAMSIAENIVNYDMPKHSNSHIIYSVDAISTAIDERKTISFLYYSLDYKKNKVYRRDGKRYVVNPLFMLSSVFRYVNALEKEGRIAKTTQGNIATPQNLRRGGTIMIPLVGSVACGAPNIGVEHIEETFAFPTSLFGSGEMFMLRTYGDSMIDVGIRKDDLIVVKKQNYANDGDIVVALVDGETTLKRFYKDGSKIILYPENKTMKDIIVKECDIQGVLVSCIKMY